MVNEVIHIKEEDLTPEEKHSIGIEEKKEKKEEKRKEGFFSKLNRKFKCKICGKNTKSKTRFCKACRKKQSRVEYM